MVQLMPLPVVYITLFISMIGMLGNLTIVMVTAHIRLLMLFEVYFISASICFYQSVYGLFSLNMQSLLGLFIGLDRLYNVSYPVKYHHVPVRYYYVSFVVCGAFATLMTFIRFIVSGEERMVSICLPVTAIYGFALHFWLLCNFIISVLVVIVYWWTHCKCQKLKALSIHVNSVEAINRILKSLTINIGLYVFTWFAAIITMSVTNKSNLQAVRFRERMREEFDDCDFAVAIAYRLLSKADTSSTASSTSSSLLCKNVPGLTPQQKRMCHENPHVIKYLISGLRSALHTCENTFQREAWNCTLTVPGIGTSPLQIASRESAYVYAISAAGVSHALARACSKGLIDDCGCGETPQASDSSANQRSSSDFVWAGCSDNVKFGNSFGRKFVDQYDRQHASEPRSQMNLHNNRVGRRLLVTAMNKECKCHGVSGSCVTKTCWKVMPKFDEFAARLHDKYQLAKLVATNDQKLFVRSTPTSSGRSERYLKTMDASSKQMRNELIYLDASPNYCAIDVKDRECGENCANICCGRGWRTTREIVDEPCHCQFVWCCEVKCKTCKKLEERNFCL
uniref:G_PROTEIN_RECEP_F1_2 domain-containing protein n=2 Tax=Caenorhabditis japonica TaxID=281687 RepID=A0A8R1DZG0_CAEJA